MNLNYKRRDEMITKTISQKNITILIEKELPKSIEETFRKFSYENIVVLGEMSVDFMQVGTNQSGTDQTGTDQRDGVLCVQSLESVTKFLAGNAFKLHAVGCLKQPTKSLVEKVSEEQGVPVVLGDADVSRHLAEATFAHIMMLLKGCGGVYGQSSAGCKKNFVVPPLEIRGKTLGIIGYGMEGTQVGILAESLGMNVQYFDSSNRLSIGNAKNVSLEELLSTSDVISIHSPPEDEMQEIIGETEIQQMKNGVSIVNLSKESKINEQAFVKAFRNGKFRGVVLDSDFELLKKLHLSCNQRTDSLLFGYDAKMMSAESEFKKGINLVEKVNSLIEKKFFEKTLQEFSENKQGCNF